MQNVPYGTPATISRMAGNIIIKFAKLIISCAYSAATEIDRCGSQSGFTQRGLIDK